MPSPGVDEFIHYHEATRRSAPGLTQRNVRRLMRVLLAPYRPKAESVALIPPGPVVLASNHGSYWDHFFIGIFVKREINYVTAAEFFPNRVLGGFVARVGASPIRPGGRDTDALETTSAVLSRGGLVVIYPEGGV